MKIREYEEESESTELGEVRMRRKESKMQDVRRLGRRGAPGPYNVDPRPSSAPAGYAGLRGGQGYPGMYPGAEDMAMNGMMLYPGMYPGMYAGVHPQGPNVSPHPSMPPQYASHESMPGYPHGTGGARNVNAYASHLPRSPSSTTSSSSSPKSRSRPLPSAIQAAINEAIQKSTGSAHTQSNPLARSKTSPATFTNDNNNGWGDGSDTCICTTNCKCRKGERGVKWYEGTAEIDGKDVPVRAKLNTRYVLKDDIGKDCDDHTECKKKASSSSSSSSSSSDTEVSKSRKSKKKEKKKTKKKLGRADKLDDLQAELNKMKQAAATKQGGPSSFSGYGPGNLEGYDSQMMKRTMEMSDPYGMGRVGGMDATGKMQGMFDPMTTHNPWLPRMPPKPGMRMQSGNDGFMEDYEDMGGASPLNPYARTSAMRGEGRDQASMPPKRRPRFGVRGDLNSDGEPRTSNRTRDRKKGGPIIRRPRRSRPFELDDTDVSLGPRRQSALRGFSSDGDDQPVMYNLPSKSCIVSVFGLHLAETSLERGDGEKNGRTSPRNGWSRISPPGRGGGLRKGRPAGKQAHAETDDDEDY